MPPLTHKDYYAAKGRDERARQKIRRDLINDTSLTEAEKAARFQRRTAALKCQACKRAGVTEFVRSANATSMGCQHERCGKTVSETPNRVVPARDVQTLAEGRVQKTMDRLVSLKIDGIVGWKEMSEVADEFADLSGKLNAWTSLRDDASNVLVEAVGGPDRTATIRALEVQLIDARRDMAAQTTPEGRARSYIENVRPLAAALREAKWPDSKVVVRGGVRVLVQKPSSPGALDIAT